MNPLTTVTFFHFKKNRYWAFKQMGLVFFRFRKNNNLYFHKFLGTAGGKGFSLWPDLSTYVFLGVWKSENDFELCFKSNPVFKDYKLKASSMRTLFLKSIHSHGSWDGINPFFNEKSIQKKENKIVVITRATLRWSSLIQFWKSIPMASKSISKATEVLYYKGIGEWPFIQQATVSIWTNLKSINDFAYKDPIHAEIIKKSKVQKWYKEDLFSRFYLLSDTSIKLNQ
jgi:hypothetical protein